MRTVRIPTGLITVLFLLIIGGVVWSVNFDSQGQMVEPGQLHTAHDTWIVIDTTTSAGDEPTDLAVTERTLTTVAAAVAAAVGGDDEISIYGDTGDEQSAMLSVNIARFRCIGITDDASVTYQIYLGTSNAGSNCELSKAGQLAFTIGQQASTTSTYELADAITVTNGGWPKVFVSTNPGSNGVAEAAIDLMGADLIVAVPTTAECDCQLLMKGY